MTPLEVFNGMDEADRPSDLRLNGFGFHIKNEGYISNSIAHDLLCWAMVKAMANSDHGVTMRGAIVGCRVGFDGEDYRVGETITALFAAYQAMRGR